MAKTVKEVRLQEEREKAAEAVKAAAKAAAEKAAAEKAAATAAAAGGSSAVAAEQPAAAADWSEEDEKALWAEWKRINDEKKAAGTDHITCSCRLMFTTNSTPLSTPAFPTLLLLLEDWSGSAS